MTENPTSRLDPRGPMVALDKVNMQRPPWARTEALSGKDGILAWSYDAGFIGPYDNLPIATLVAEGWIVYIGPRPSGDRIRIKFRRKADILTKENNR